MIANGYSIEPNANLQGADLRSADLQCVNLQGANLRYADLRSANLRYADLQGVNLRHADLRHADLRHADLRHADLDFSCWPLWCGSKGVKVDKRLAVQLAYHFCALTCDDAEYQAARSAILAFANQMHRTDVERLQ